LLVLAALLSGGRIDGAERAVSSVPARVDDSIGVWDSRDRCAGGHPEYDQRGCANDCLSHVSPPCVSDERSTEHLRTRSLLRNAALRPPTRRPTLTHVAPLCVSPGWGESPKDTRGRLSQTCAPRDEPSVNPHVMGVHSAYPPRVGDVTRAGQGPLGPGRIARPDVGVIRSVRYSHAAAVEVWSPLAVRRVGDGDLLSSHGPDSSRRTRSVLMRQSLAAICLS